MSKGGSNSSPHHLARVVELHQYTKDKGSSVQPKDLIHHLNTPLISYLFISTVIPFVNE
jgi:hypothetical protein